MHPLIHDFIVLAQQGRFGRGETMFKWGVTGVGVAVLIAAVGVVLSKPKDPAKRALTPAVKVTAALVFAAFGFGLIAYAWLVF